MYRTEFTGNHGTGIQGDTHIQVWHAQGLVTLIQRIHRQLHFNCAGDRVLNVIRFCIGNTEDNQYGIAHKFVNGTAVLGDYIPHAIEVTVEQGNNVSGSMSLGYLREATNIG